MKITFFIGSLYGGGAERVTCNLASYLVSQGHQAEILTMSETKEKYELNTHVTVKSLLSLSERRGNAWNTTIRLLRLWRYLWKTQNDVYIVMLPKTTIMLLLFRWMIKGKVIAAERNDPEAYSSKIGMMLKRLAQRADGFIFQTEGARAWYGDVVKNLETEVIPNAVNPAFIRPAYYGDKRKVIAGVGRLSNQKNFTMLISAFAKIESEFPDYNLVIYGEGEKRGELEQLVDALELQSRIFLPGNISNIADEMEKNSMFVLSSDYEGMPNALMEAMALGLPCISTDCPCGGPRFLIREGENGILVPVGDVDKMAEAMRRVMTDKAFREKISQSAEKIQERLASDKIYSIWETFILKVVEDSKKKAR